MSTFGAILNEVVRTFFMFLTCTQEFYKKKNPQAQTYTENMVLNMHYDGKCKITFFNEVIIYKKYSH